MTDRPRLFIALDIPEEAVKKVMEFQKVLKKAGIQGKWIYEKNIHLTLKFIGETDPENIDIIQNILEETASAFRPFNLAVSNAGVFPDIERPSVAWTGIDGETGLVMKLARITDRLLFEKSGIKRETKAFKPHITVARFRNRISPVRLEKTIEEISQKPPFPFIADTVTLYKSFLSREGAKYTALKKIILKTGDPD